jgi:hypothetical protein
VNGLYSAPELARPIPPGATKAVLASSEAASLGRWRVEGLVYKGFREEEHDGDRAFRWADPMSGLVLDGREFGLSFASAAARLGCRVHPIFVSVDGKTVTVSHLT